jgi:hypothetical protein
MCGSTQIIVRDNSPPARSTHTDKKPYPLADTPADKLIKGALPDKTLAFFTTKCTKKSLNHQIERYREDDINPDIIPSPDPIPDTDEHNPKFPGLFECPPSPDPDQVPRGNYNRRCPDVLPFGSRPFQVQAGKFLS